MSFHWSDNNEHDANASGAHVVRSTNSLPTLRSGLKQQVLKACLAARRKRQSDRLAAGKAIVTTALILFGMGGFDAFGSISISETPAEIALVAEVKYQQVSVSSSTYSMPLASMSELGTMEHVERIIGQHEINRNRLLGISSG